MQLKLLNFYKFLAALANNLVGAFIPLIIFNATGNLSYAFLYLIAQESIKFVTTFLLKNLYRKYPQIFLLMRIFTLTLYNIFIFVLDYNLILGIIGICLFFGIDQSFKNNSNELIYNYSSLNKGSSSLGLTRIFEQLGAISALLVGGFLLDINKKIVVIIALSLYAIAIIPLIVFYIKGRNNALLNIDAISNASLRAEKNKKISKRVGKITSKILIYYALVYFVFCTYDIYRTTFVINLFSSGSANFALAGIFAAVFNGAYGVGTFVAGKLNDKVDSQILVQIACIVMSLICLLLPFTQDNIYLICTGFLIIGLVYPFVSVFVFQRLIVKSRILGVSNSALLIREESSVASYIFLYIIGLICTLFNPITLLPVFIIVAICLFFSTLFIPLMEEKTRKLLVDFLQENEIKSYSERVSKSIKRKK